MWPAHRPSTDWLVVRSLGVTITNFLVPAVLGSTVGGQQVNFSQLVGASVSEEQLAGLSSECYP